MSKKQVNRFNTTCFSCGGDVDGKLSEDNLGLSMCLSCRTEAATISLKKLIREKSFARGNDNEYLSDEASADLAVVDQFYLMTTWMLNQMDYKSYLQTDHWQRFRLEAIEHCGGKCQLCGKTEMLQVHHKNYKNRGWETFDDVIVICSKCHDKQHQ